MAAPAAQPEPGREYPIKLGATMSGAVGNGGGGGGAARKSYFALQVVHMPDVTEAAGALKREDEKLHLRVPTTAAGSGHGVSLMGTRSKASSKMGEYIFEFRNGVVYIQRVSDSFAGIRQQPGEVAVEPPTPPTPQTPSAGPVTDAHAPSGGGSSSGGSGVALPPIGGIAKKRTSPTHHPVARKKVGAKTVPRNGGGGGDQSSSDSSGDSSDSDSDGSSDNDSDDYTSESSDGD